MSLLATNGLSLQTANPCIQKTASTNSSHPAISPRSHFPQILGHSQALTVISPHSLYLRVVLKGVLRPSTLVTFFLPQKESSSFFPIQLLSFQNNLFFTCWSHPVCSPKQGPHPAMWSRSSWSSSFRLHPYCTSNVYSCIFRMFTFMYVCVQSFPCLTCVSSKHMHTIYMHTHMLIPYHKK